MVHMTACGYKLAADVIMSYIDYLIRHHMEDFKLAWNDRIQKIKYVPMEEG